FFRLLLEADEALSAPARSIDPKLVLEMCVVRLATLPPLLPMDDILRRLEALGTGVPAARPSAPVARSETPPSRTAPATGIWERFLARVQDVEKGVFMKLAGGRLISSDGEALRIGIGNETMRR